MDMVGHGRGIQVPAQLNIYITKLLCLFDIQKEN
jgi:hypothetical protein